MKFISLFAGIGGFDLGLERAGMECVAQVEINDWCQRVLTKHWPNVPKFKDVKDVTKETAPTVELICGGFPCQPHSTAGKRLGAKDDRDLWPEFFRIVEEIRPNWIIAENVAGLTSMAFYKSEPEVDNKGNAVGNPRDLYHRRGRGYLKSKILEPLEKIGYTVEAVIIPACAVNAPHRRDRVWIIAHSNSIGERLDTSKQTRPSLHNKDWFSQAQEPERDYLQSEPNGNLSINANANRIDGGGLYGREFEASWPQGRPRVLRNNHGIPHWVDRIRGLGNAVVPQVAQFIGESIMAVDANASVGA